jgi:hypothetical protein
VSHALDSASAAALDTCLFKSKVQFVGGEDSSRLRPQHRERVLVARELAEDVLVEDPHGDWTQR